MTQIDETKYLIVGAGVTGLAFANFVNVPADQWLVIERDEEPGGYCRTIIQDGFVWDYSGHFFHFRHPEIEEFLRQRMPGQRVETIEKSSGILYKNHRIDFPFQKNIHQLPLPDFLDCLHDLYFRDATSPISNFEEMVVSRFGTSIAEKFLIPYNEKLYACSLSRLDVNAMGRFFPNADVSDVIRNFKTSNNASYNASFTYPAGGAIEYIRALLHDLPSERIQLNESLVSIDHTQRIAVTNRRKIRFEHLISSIPYVRLQETLGRRWDPTIFTWNKVLVFNLGFDRKGQNRDHWLYIPDPEIVFYRVGFYDNIFNTDRMSLYVEIGLDRDAEVGDIDTHKAKVLAGLRKLGIVTDQTLISSHSVLLDPAYVHITAASKTLVERDRAELAGHGIHSLGRYGGWTYCAIEDNIVEAKALAAEIG